MSVTVFTWDMFKFGSHFGVGHAALWVKSPKHSAYISFWPAQHSIGAGWNSVGKVHFMTGDKEQDGVPGWASKPITNLDEARIVKFWQGFDLSALDAADGTNRKTRVNGGGVHYNIIASQCSTTVVTALLVGADRMLRSKIGAWLALNAGTCVDFGGARNFAAFLPGFRIPTITPADVRELVKAVWDDC